MSDFKGLPSITEVKVPYIFKTDDSLQSLINIKRLAEDIANKKDTIAINIDFPIHLEAKKNTDSTHLVVKVLKYRNKLTGEIIVKPQILGIVEKQYTFESLADFHFVPKIEDKDLLPKLKNYLSNEEQLSALNIDKDNKKASSESNNIDGLMYSILPSSFSKIYNSYPQKASYIYEDINNQIINEEKKESGSRFVAQFIHFSDKDIPQPIKEPEYIRDKEDYKFLKNCFLERPVWLKNSLIVMSKGKVKFESFHMFKKCMSYLAYSFKDGPWKNTYVRYGYDPRGEPSSIQYQVVDVGLPDKQSKYEALNLCYKRNEFETYDPKFIEPLNKLRQMYQLCDIIDIEIKQILEKEMQRLQNKEDLKPADRKYGWITPKNFKNIIKYMKNKFKLT